MSDPVTNVEIEDVLSSIRRLVSDEGRVAREPATAAESHETEEAADNTPDTPHVEEARPAPALILTPALRIADEPAPEAEAEDEQATTEETEADTASDAAAAAPLVLKWDDSLPDPAEDTAVEDDHAPVSAFVPEEDATQDEASAEAEDAVEDSYDEQDDEDDSSVEQEIIAEVEYEELETEEAEPDTEGDLPPQAMMEDASQSRSIEDKIAALEALIGKSNSDYEPDGAEANAAARPRTDRLPWPEEAAVAPDAQPEADSQSTDFNAEAIAFELARSAAVQEAEEGLVEAAAHTLPEGLDGDGAPLIDEDALRDMVADIVRQELQGPLGERITRNVRKLVRREIYRAMAANELD